jgi:hypothetical protein
MGSRYVPEWDAMPSDDSDDPDYREDSFSSSGDDELPKTLGRDRARWVEDNVEVIQEIYKLFKDNGRAVFGNAFFQCGDITSFAHFCYKHTTPGASK